MFGNNTFRGIPGRYTGADRSKKSAILQDMTDAAAINAGGISITR